MTDQKADPKKIVFFKPYTRITDDLYKIGFDSTVEVSFPLKEKDKIDVETQANVLALKYAQAYIDFILSPLIDRQRIDHRGEITVNDGEE